MMYYYCCCSTWDYHYELLLLHLRIIIILTTCSSVACTACHTTTSCYKANNYWQNINNILFGTKSKFLICESLQWVYTQTTHRHHTKFSSGRKGSVICMLPLFLINIRSQNWSEINSNHHQPVNLDPLLKSRDLDEQEQDWKLLQKKFYLCL